MKKTSKFSDCRTVLVDSRKSIWQLFKKRVEFYELPCYDSYYMSINVAKNTKA